jgi:hypothetical protein
VTTDATEAPRPRAGGNQPEPIPFAPYVVYAFFGTGIALTALLVGGVTWRVRQRLVARRAAPPSLGRRLRTRAGVDRRFGAG